MVGETAVGEYDSGTFFGEHFGSGFEWIDAYTGPNALDGQFDFPTRHNMDARPPRARTLPRAPAGTRGQQTMANQETCLRPGIIAARRSSNSSDSNISSCEPSCHAIFSTSGMRPSLRSRSRSCANGRRQI